MFKVNIDNRVQETANEEKNEGITGLLESEKEEDKGCTTKKTSEGNSCNDRGNKHPRVMAVKLS